MPSLRPLANRQSDSPFQLPDDGWYQLAPSGEYPVATIEGSLVQVLDETAFAAMVEAFGRAAELPDFAGLLVDFDHFSMDLDKPSEAAGWIAELTVREGTLWGQIRWSDRGEQAVAGGSYRFLSPVFDRPSAEPLDGNRVRPVRLRGAGLTNDPNLRGIRPLSNRNGGDPPHTQEAARMKQRLAEILQLAPEAPDEAFLSAVQELRNRAVQVQTDQEELARLREQAVESRVNEDLQTYRDRIADPEKAKAALLANREAAIGILAALSPAAPAASPNRRTGKVPAADPASGTSGDEAAAAAIRNRAAQIQRDQKVTFTTAWRLAEQELG